MKKKEYVKEQDLLKLLCDHVFDITCIFTYLKKS